MPITILADLDQFGLSTEERSRIFASAATRVAKLRLRTTLAKRTISVNLQKRGVNQKGAAHPHG